MSHARKHSFRPRLCRLEDRTAPAAGMLDPTFGLGGRVTTRLPSPSDDSARATAIDSLGRIVVAGKTYNGLSYDFAVIRYTSAGALDTSFGGTGVVTFDFAGSVNAVAIDSLDRVVVAGDSFDGSTSVFGVVRLTVAGGALDPSFDGDGKQTIAFGASQNEAYGVAVDSLNRVVVAGFTVNGSNFDIAVGRLTATGALDSTFDGDGKQTIAFGASDEQAYAVTVDSQDSVVVAGYTFNGSNNFVAVVRLTVTGTLDSSFDGDGKQTVAFGTSDVVALGVAVDSLSRIVVAGNTFNGSDYDFAVARLSTAAPLDSSFDGDGKQVIAFGTNNDFATGVAVDSLDRVVVAGYVYSVNPVGIFAVGRLTADGALDSSFDGDGRQTIAFGPQDDEAFGVAVDALDRTVVAGYTLNGLTNDFAAARLTVGGSLDSNFSGDGKVTLGLASNSVGLCNAIAVDSRGRTLVAGLAYDGSRYSFAVARYTAVGALDSTFGGTGIVTFPFGTQSDWVNGVAVDSLDRVIVAGYTVNGSINDFAVVRLAIAGALDTSFDGDGKQTIHFSGGGSASEVAVDSLDRIVVAGTSGTGTNSDFAVARLTITGALDSSFDGDGMQTIAFGASTDAASGVAVDSLDRVEVVGYTNVSNHDFAVARLTVTGALDSSFDGDGKQTIAFGSVYDEANGVAIDSLDRVVVGGSTGAGSGFDFAVVRLTTAGALDNSFDGDGRQTIDFGASDNFGNAVAVDSLNRVVIAGVTNFGGVDDFAVTRLTAGGALDPSFDADGRQTIGFGADDDRAYAVAVDSAGRALVAGQSYSNGIVFAVARLTGDTTTASAQVNDGSAQRSRVTSLTVRFSGSVTFSGAAEQAFLLVRTGAGAVNFTAHVSVEYGGTVVTLDAFTGSEAEFGSLKDGRYTLTTVASQISAGGQALDGDANGTPGGNFVFGDSQGLFRMFGDINGDQSVNGLDFGFFRNAFGTQTGDANYLGYLDINGDGVINGFDFGQFRARFGTTLP